MKRKTIEQLLKENKKALQFLHSAAGVDFERDFFIDRIEGKFTFNTVTKAIENKLSGDYVAALLLKPTKEHHFNKELYFIRLQKGGFDPLKNNGTKYWDFDIDYFFSIKDFENVRKNKTDHFYIIAQKRELLNKTTQKSADMLQRFELDKDKRTYYRDGCDHCSDGRGNRWINKLYLVKKDGSRERLTFEPYSSFYPGENRSDNITDYIDKSGFLLRPRQMELKRKARTLKAERDKAAAAAANFEKEEKTINRKIKETCERIAAEALAIKTEKDAKTIEETARKLARALWHYDYYKEKSAGNLYASKEQKERTIKTIFEYLQEAEEKTA